MDYSIIYYQTIVTLRWRVSSLMSYGRSFYFFILDSRNVLKFYSWIQLAIVYLHINFQSQKILTNFVI